MRQMLADEHEQSAMRNYTSLSRANAPGRDALIQQMVVGGIGNAMQQSAQDFQGRQAGLDREFHGQQANIDREHQIGMFDRKQQAQREMLPLELMRIPDMSPQGRNVIMNQLMSQTPPGQQPRSQAHQMAMDAHISQQTGGLPTAGGEPPVSSGQQNGKSFSWFNAPKNPAVEALSADELSLAANARTPQERNYHLQRHVMFSSGGDLGDIMRRLDTMHVPDVVAAKHAMQEGDEGRLVGTRIDGGRQSDIDGIVRGKIASRRGDVFATNKNTYASDIVNTPEFAQWAKSAVERAASNGVSPELIPEVVSDLVWNSVVNSGIDGTTINSVYNFPGIDELLNMRGKNNPVVHDLAGIVKQNARDRIAAFAAELDTNRFRDVGEAMRGGRERANTLRTP